jgi:uncharacterized protein YdeI (YjbR/CyaY-like superfamily)
MVRLVPHDVAFFASVVGLCAWLEANGEAADELWVGLVRASKGRPAPITWAGLVDEILCAGWIDSVRMPLDAEWHAIRITPRRTGSVWSARNVARVEALRAEGRMRPAGEAAFARRRKDRTAIYSFDGGFAFDEAAEAAIRARPGPWAWFEAQPPGYRRQAAHWVMSAKRAETRAGRLARLIDGCAAGERLPEITGAARSGTSARFSPSG